MTDKYTLEKIESFYNIRDRDNKYFICTISYMHELTLNDIVNLMNQAYKEGGKLCSSSSSCFEIEELKLKNKNLSEEYEFIKRRNNDLEKALDYAYRASDILKKMGHRYCRKMYGIENNTPDDITIKKEDGLFGTSFTIKKGDETHGMIKDIDEKTVNEKIQPLINYFYNEGKKDAKNDR